MTQTRPVAIVTDGLWRKSLSAIRSLGKAGFDVYVMGDSLFTTGFWSHYTTGHVIAPTAAQDPAAFKVALKKLLTSLPDRPVIFPMEDASLLSISEDSKKFNTAAILLPPKKSLIVAENKAETIRLAQKLKIPCPQTWFPRSAAALYQQLKALPAGEYLVKPYHGSGSAGIVYDLTKSKTEWESHWNTFGALIIQERIPASGTGLGISLLYDAQGKLLASFAHQRLQQYPNSGGPSTDRIAINAPEITRLSQKLLKKLNWTGVAMVEWKLDPRDNQPKLMEINPRFWGSLELAVRSGVNFPVLYAQAALNQQPSAVTSYTIPTRCRWLIPGDILRYLTQNQSQRESLTTFLRNMSMAEEWDMHDLSGFVATIVCTAALALNPKYWRYVRRG